MNKKKLPVNVAFFSHDANLKGGGSISLLNLLDEIQKDNICCFVFLPGRGEFSHELDQRNIEYAILPNAWWVSYGYKFDNSNLLYRNIKSHLFYYNKALQKAYKNLKALPKYVRLINKHKIDVLYTNTSVVFMGALLSILLRKPHIWHIREYRGDFRFDFGHTLFNFLLKRAKAKIFVSEALQRQYPKFAHHPSSFVIYNGIPIPQISKTYKKNKEFFTFSMVGKLTKSKGQEVAIEALSYLKENLPDLRLVLAGKGKAKYVAYLEEMCRKLNVEKNVVFLGPVSNPFKVYYASDAYLMCSTNETFGRVTVEAMLTKLPVIGYESEATGTKEIIVNGETGLLYTGGAKELSICMERLVRDPALLSKLGKNAYERAVHTFGVDVYTKKIESIIQYTIS